MMANEQTERTRIYTAFLSAGLPVGYEAYRRHHPHVKVMQNQEIHEILQDELADVELVGDAEVQKAEDAVSAIRQQEQDLDGVLVFGPPSAELISIGLPMVAVERPLQGCTTVPFHAYEDSRVLTAFLPAHRDKDAEVYSRRLTDIARKLELIDAIAQMKRLRVLVVTDKPVLGYFEPMDVQIEATREEYEETYIDNLTETFGTQFIAVPQEDLLGRMPKMDQQEAREIADGWIAEAMALRGTDQEQVFESAKLYLAMKELMAEHDCGAITTEGYGWPPHGYDKGIASQGLPSSQLCTDGIAAASETLTDCLLTQQLALYITGSAGLLGDYTLDPFNGTAIVAHCEGTFRPYADERRAPYIIRNLPFVAENVGGACVQINYPIGETVTVAKLGTHERKLSVFTGQTVSGEELFPYWDDILGRNKLAIKTDAQALLENVDWQAFGNHRTAFFGDFRQQFKDLGKLIGFEVVEKDR